MEAIITYLVANGGTILAALSAIIGGFSIIATLTPNQTDNKVINALLKVINFLAANFGNAKNDPNVGVIKKSEK
jgi:phage I-like protein